MSPQSHPQRSHDGTPVTHHILSVLVENRFGVLTRVAGLFARRGFNIVSLAVSPTENPDFSRMTIVVDAESAPLEQVTKQLNKLIPVLEIAEISEGAGVERELMLVTVSNSNPSVLNDLVATHAATAVDESGNHVTLMLTGTPGVLDEFEQLVKPHGIVELQRTGRIALPTLSG